MNGNEWVYLVIRASDFEWDARGDWSVEAIYTDQADADRHAKELGSECEVECHLVNKFVRHRNRQCWRARATFRSGKVRPGPKAGEMRFANKGIPCELVEDDTGVTVYSFESLGTAVCLANGILSERAGER